MKNDKHIEIKLWTVIILIVTVIMFFASCSVKKQLPKEQPCPPCQNEIHYIPIIIDTNKIILK
jgi:hypothetical protein